MRFNQRYGLRKMKSRDILASLISLIMMLGFCASWLKHHPLSKCAAHTFNQLVRSIVFDLCIDVHCNLTALMACQILNRFGINRRMDQVRDVCMPQLIGCYFKSQSCKPLSHCERPFPQNSVTVCCTHAFPSSLSLDTQCFVVLVTIYCQNRPNCV